LLLGLALVYDLVQWVGLASATRDLKRLAAQTDSDEIAALVRGNRITNRVVRTLLREAVSAKELNSLLQFQFSTLVGRLRVPQTIAASLTLVGLFGTVYGLLTSLRGV